MKTITFAKKLLGSLVAAFGTAAMLFVLSAGAAAQTDSELKEALTKAIMLVEQNRLAEAEPYLATLVKVSPKDAKLRGMYGLALLTKSKQIPAGDEAKRLSAEALVQFEEARRLGFEDPQMDSLIEMLGGRPTLKQGVTNAEPTAAETYMQKAEVYFAQSKYDEALTYYQKALAADPKNYEAALFSGDVYVTRSDWANAEKMYQLAIGIDPDRETAYRYSATPFMKQKKYDQALERYVEAYITEPHGGRSSDGISQWAQITGARLGHPKVDLPKADAVSGAGASKWAEAYLAERAEWRKSKFAKLYTDEKEYRHTVAEEVESIRSGLRAAKAAKLEDEQLSILQKLDNQGLLEAFVYLSKPDVAIVSDYGAYLKANRPKLREYVRNFLISK